MRKLFTASTPLTVTNNAEALNLNGGVSLMLTEVVHLVTLSLVIPATSASAERNFTALCQLKNENAHKMNCTAAKT